MQEFKEIYILFADVFMVSREVEKSLANHETARCIGWCHDNRSKLRKLGSTMEFNLRVQEFIELVRSDRRLDAVKHARKYFANCDDYQLQEIQCCMGQLAFPAHAYLSPYKDLLDEKRFISDLIFSWNYAICNFDLFFFFNISQSISSVGKEEI